LTRRKCSSRCVGFVRLENSDDETQEPNEAAAKRIAAI
jgi:hypothetical protein